MTEIATRVRAWAKGMYPTEAGAELLIRHGAIHDGAPWLTDHGGLTSIDTFVLLDETGAWSGGERRIVAIAASLLDGAPVDLCDIIPGLDRKNLALVLAAIAHANGSHEDGGIRFSDDGVPLGFYRDSSLYPWPEPISR
ncbi:hypothetical protein [Agromyces mariniharenae]|uniref:Uncharacterized protein n=1 Tax=Agromyces mariniharenae TaxID=2604423 RepID=A0A5S4UTZ2_9MICO|nr:hypothetical protein [Agromyces mariniharenae]TYL50444.1 hypothetical protein FYC51_14650 [Agromyces mariniharenae]